MSVIPSMRPMAVVKRQALRRGLRGNSQAWRWIAVLLVGRSAVVRNVAIRDGLRGGNRFWRYVAVGIMISDLASKFVVKEPDRLGVERLKPGQGVKVKSLGPDRRRAAS